ncbi:MAG: ABC transporter permease [Epsilonproteobacteria bacterium]|nr:ABC transporter permease [Campylobacterota bacterium]
MNINMLVTTALRSLGQHKTRALLTTLGIIIGVVSIIAVMAIGHGAKYQVTKEIQKLGPNFIIVLATTPKNMAQRGGISLNLKDSDFDAIRDECDAIFQMSRGLQTNETVVFEGQNWQTMITGVDANYFDIRNWKLTKGEYFTEQDLRSATKVALLGKTVAKELFGNTNPIGHVIRIKKLPFKVIGVLEEMGKTPDGRDQDDMVYAPTTTIQRKVIGTKNYAALIMNATSKDLVKVASNQVRAVLRQQHRLKPQDDDDFTLFTQNDIAQAADAATAVLNVLLLIIAAISLVVGGIGIMNIMLVSVTERTREIGIRMALGATTQNILTQFLLESMVICLIGGLLGLMLGVSAASIIGLVLGWPIFVSTTSVGLSVCSSVMVGIFFGYYPAYKASQLNPVDALLER